MRALCGAIVAAGAVIGLGLTALGIGTRYQMDHAATNAPPLIHVSQMDRPLVFVLVVLTGAMVIGLGVMFVGLAYHHHRRDREFHLERSRAATHQPTTV